MNVMNVFVDFVGPVFLLVAAFLVRRHFIELMEMIQFNVQGGGPMERLVPNFAFLFLFLMLFSLGM